MAAEEQIPPDGRRLRSSLRRWEAFGAKPPQIEIFELLRVAGRNAREAGELVDELMRTWPDGSELSDRIGACEAEGDRVTHKIINCLRASKMTPFDREDIFALAGAIDDVVDYLEEASDLLGLYGVEMPTRHAVEQCAIIVKAVDFEPSRKTVEPADQLIAETLSDPGIVEVGYYDGQRYTVTLEELPAKDGVHDHPIDALRYE